MSKLAVFSATLILYLIPQYSIGLEKLDLIIDVFQIEDRGCSSGELSATLTDATEKAKAGQLLFNSKSLSGDRDVACADCHIKEEHFADGLPIAIGVGGKGQGPNRLKSGKGVLVPRNAFTLLGRGHSQFKVLFWDGKIQQVDSKIFSPFGEVHENFDSALAVAAILPLLSRDEFLGEQSVFSENDLEYKAGNKYHLSRYKALQGGITSRLRNPSHKLDLELVTSLKRIDENLIPSSLMEIGNSLAAFIAEAFPCQKTRWDNYISGDSNSLTEQEKSGAEIFYGRGRCASCHSGPTGSDFQFHSIGAPESAFGPHSRRRDLGRAGVTHIAEDLYQFRTPPLLSVSKTAPYGHNGIFESLEDIVIHHYDPVAIYIRNPDVYLENKQRLSRTLDTRSHLLSAIDIQSAEDLRSLIAFLQLL